MSKKSSNARRIPVNVVKKYENVIDCKSCGEIKSAKRIVVLAGKTKKGWACNSCSMVSFERAITKEV